MSLTAILKKIEKVDQKHRQILQRYSSACKLCPRQDELETEQQEDRRIFGYSSSQILGLYKPKSNAQLQQTRPCTANLGNTRTLFQKIQRQSRNSCNEVRIKSASKPAFQYREQYNFLFKEDIFDENHLRMKSASPSFELHKKKAETRLAKNLRRHQVPFSIQELHLKSMQEQKNKFIENFDTTIEIMQKREKQQTVSKKRNDKMTYDRKKTALKKATHQVFSVEDEDLFRLTKAPLEQQSRKLKVALNSSHMHLKPLTGFLNVDQRSQFLRLDKMNKQPMPFVSLFQEIVRLLPSKFSLTCISVSSLLSLSLNILRIDEQLFVQESRQKVDLNTLKESLGRQQGCVHLCFWVKEELLYELFITSCNWSPGKRVELEVNLASYYLKRFMLLDGKSSIKTVQQSTDLMIKSNVDIPDEFLQFLKTFNRKLAHFCDKDKRYYSLNLQTVLMSGLKTIQAFKKERGLGQKVVKLREGTKKEFKTFSYNWAYFYICLSLVY